MTSGGSGTPLPPIPRLRLCRSITMPSFYVTAGDLKPGPHAYAASTSHTDHVLSPPVYFLNGGTDGSCNVQNHSWFTTGS